MAIIVSHTQDELYSDNHMNVQSIDGSRLSRQISCKKQNETQTNEQYSTYLTYLLI